MDGLAGGVLVNGNTRPISNPNPKVIVIRKFNQENGWLAVETKRCSYQLVKLEPTMSKVQLSSTSFDPKISITRKLAACPQKFHYVLLRYSDLCHKILIIDQIKNYNTINNVVVQWMKILLQCVSFLPNPTSEHNSIYIPIQKIYV